VSAAFPVRLLGAAVGVIGVLTLGAWARGTASPYLQAPQALSRADQERLDHVASASLFGELRGGLADYLWMKADRVLHNGVETRALTRAEERSGRRWRASSAAGEKEKGVECHAEGETTVVPNPEADRRGILGDLERQVKPYMDMRNHHHRDVTDAMSLFRLMTWANPHFISGWVVGANVLAGALGRPQQALSFLREAEKQNPESLEIQEEIGRYLMYRFHAPAAAEQRFRRAIALGAARETLTADERQGWEDAHRWLFIRYHLAGRRREAREIARIAVQRFPDSGYFLRALQRREIAGRQAS
jgi:tetratricopeptide (TPR) repeat protein